MPTLPHPPSLLDLCRYQYGDLFTHEYDVLVDMRSQHGLTASVDTRTGDVTFHVGIVPVTHPNGGYTIHYPPTT